MAERHCCFISSCVRYGFSCMTASTAAPLPPLPPVSPPPLNAAVEKAHHARDVQSVFPRRTLFREQHQHTSSLHGNILRRQLHKQDTSPHEAMNTMCCRSLQQLLQRDPRHRGRQAGAWYKWRWGWGAGRASPHGRASSWLCSPWCSAPPRPLSRTLPAPTPPRHHKHYKHYSSVGCKTDALFITLYPVGSGIEIPVNSAVKIRST